MSYAHKFAIAALLAANLAAPATTAAAQDYPNRPIKIIAPFGAGGPGDVFSRQLAQFLPEVLKIGRRRESPRRRIGHRRRRSREIRP